MDDTLKQRLIGALVLIALAVIFIPVLFDRDRVEPVDQQTMIPLPPIVKDVNVNPPVDTFEVEKADNPKFLFSPREDNQEALDLAKAETVPETLPKTERKVAPKPVEKKPAAEKKTIKAAETLASLPKKNIGLPEGWVLQVASFADVSRAKELQKKLNNTKDFRAYIKTVPTPNGSRSRVFVGPKLERAEIEKIKAEVDKTFGVKSLIVRFEP